MNPNVNGSLLKKRKRKINVKSLILEKEKKNFGVQLNLILSIITDKS